ncbi:MAG TPA: hypothetical protein VGC81_06690 [Candidatus Methylomirabilis sp.]
MFGCVRPAQGRLPLLFLITLGLATSCGDDPAGPDTPSRVTGRVEGPGGFASPSGTLGPRAVEGATVVLVRVAADGSQNVISLAPETTDAKGRFVLETDVEGRGRFLVTATGSNSSWRALVSAGLAHGTAVASPPLNSESTAEADVFLMLSAGAESGARADVAAGINARLGVGAVEQTSVRAALAEGFAFGGDVTTEALARAGMTAEQLEAAAEGRLSALVHFEAALHAAETSADMKAAVNGHLEADLGAPLDAGVAAETQAWVRAAAGLGVLQTAEPIQGDARVELARRTAEIRARATALAVAKIFTDLNAPAPTLVSLAGARISVLAAIDAAGTRPGIEAALEAYHEAILNALEVTLGLRGGAVVSSQAALNEVGGPVFDLELALVVAATADAWADAFTDFRATVRSVVAVNLTAAPATEVDAVADCLTLLNVPLD